MPEPALIINIDDNEPSRYAKSRVLRYAGFNVMDGGTGTEALELAARHAPDLVLLDVHLPDIDGIEVCRRLKGDTGTASILILQISATATTATHATESLNSGADSYIAEPVDPDVLVASVRALLRLRQAERALAIANEHLEVLNRDLQKSNESLEQFAFVASHDLQEPLRTVTTFAGLLKRSSGPRLNEQEQEYLQYIVGGADRMRLLIDDLLHYSQVGQSPADSAFVDLNEAYTWALENLRELIVESNAEVTSDTLPGITGDGAQLRHVVQNLIGNALKYRRPGLAPRVHLVASRTADAWLIEVKDNGIGIERQYWESVFVPFKRLHGRNIPGTGIGLAVCRRVIEAHGGRIWLESVEGEGSTFSFTLPTKEATATAS